MAGRQYLTHLLWPLLQSYGLKGAVSLRVIQNVFGVVFALAFCVIFYWFMSKKKENEVTVHAE